MPTEPLIPASDFCAYHRLDIDFVYSLEQRGLIELSIVEQTVYLYPDQLGPLEKLVRLHRELAVHVDDLDIVTHLLDRMENLQGQVTRLRNQLTFYEPAAD